MDEQRNVPKRIKRLLREQAAIAYEEELRRALLALAAEFKNWEEGRMGNGELAGKIHDFHQGPSRELFVKYDSRMHRLAVAEAIVSGVLPRSGVPPELLEHLAGALEYYEAGKKGK